MAGPKIPDCRSSAESGVSGIDHHIHKRFVGEDCCLLANLEVDLLASIVLPECLADHFGERLKGQGAEDRIFDVHAEISLQELRRVMSDVLKKTISKLRVRKYEI
jgi:hypothetical protein